MEPERVPLASKAYVAAFLVALLVCAVGFVEVFPFTGWRLFSYTRPAHRTGWEAVTFDGAGRERRIIFATFPPAYRRLQLVMRDFHTRSPAARERICAAWATHERDAGRDVAGVRIYRRVVDLHDHKGRRRPPPARRSLAYTCARQGGGPVAR